MVVDSKGSLHASQTACILYIYIYYFEVVGCSFFLQNKTYICILFADNSHCLYIPPFNLHFLLLKLHVYTEPLLRGWRQSDPMGSGDGDSSTPI